jgi:hypothetical protein
VIEDEDEEGFDGDDTAGSEDTIDGGEGGGHEAATADGSGADAVDDEAPELTGAGDEEGPGA